MRKEEGASIDTRRCHEFIKWISDCHMIDMDSVSSKVTWKGPKWEEHDKVFERLDRFLCNPWGKPTSLNP